MQHYILAWDPVPRLPLCQTWLKKVLPRFKVDVLRSVQLKVMLRSVGDIVNELTQEDRWSATAQALSNR